jgi:hypothetical protein
MNAKVTVRKAAAETEALIQPDTHVVTDAKGRAITLTKPGPLAQFRLVRMLPADVAENRAYVMMVLPLLFVTAIDGDGVPPPQTERQIEALIQRLDEGGLAAVISGVQEKWGSQDPEAAAGEIKK